MKKLLTYLTHVRHYYCMKKLTDRQREVVKFIYEGQKIGNTPTLFELAEKLGVTSKQTVKDLLDAVAKKGYLTREPRRPRAIILKPEAIYEVEKNYTFFKNIQLGLQLSFTEGSNAFQWYNPSNITINQGKLSNELEQILIDSSSLIPLANQKKEVIENYARFQLVTEKSNFDRLQSSTSNFLSSSEDYIVVTPTMPNINDQTGYLVLEENSQYKLVWSGVSSSHYYSFGKEYGDTTNISIIDGGSQQMKLFSESMDQLNLFQTISTFKNELKSWSHYVDFPIYGAALKESGEIIFWSKKTARNIYDLRYLFLVDITGTHIIGRDKALLRDISCNFPTLTTNSTY